MAGWLEDKRLVIIGGTSGMGLAAARACALEGARLVICGKEVSDTDSLRPLSGQDHQVVYADAVEPDTAERLISRCVETWGGLDGLLHVAGGSGRRFGDGPLHLMTDEGWQKTMEWNLTSVMFSNRAAIRQFLKQGTGGSILNMGSVLGSSPSPAYFSTHAYAAAKSAIIGFSKSVAACYARENIRVNVIAPGLMATPMAQRAMQDELIHSFIKSKQPLDGGRAGLAEDIEGLAVFLFSDKSSFITGQVIAVDGGWSLTDGQYPVQS